MLSKEKKVYISLSRNLETRWDIE